MIFLIIDFTLCNLEHFAIDKINDLGQGTNFGHRTYTGLAMIIGFDQGIQFWEPNPCHSMVGRVSGLIRHILAYN